MLLEYDSNYIENLLDFLAENGIPTCDLETGYYPSSEIEEESIDRINSTPGLTALVTPNGLLIEKRNLS
jgi:hypothetical protein